MKINLKCDMLVDQDRYMGSDPVGYKCGNDAAEERPDGALICAMCLVIAANDPARLTRSPIFGREYQEAVIRNVSWI